MQNIKEMQTGFIVDSAYLRTRRLKYTHSGRKKFWDFLDSHESVHVMPFNVTRKVMTFIRLFRPAVYFCSLAPSDQVKTAIDLDKYHPSLGYTTEFCAGIVEPDKPRTVTAAEEVFAHTGYKISIHDLELVTTYRKCVRITGSTRTTYFIEVTDDCRIDERGSVDDKISECVEMTIPEMEDIIRNCGPHNMSPSCLFGIMWFLHYRAPRYKQECSSSNENKVAVLSEDDMKL